MEGLETIIDKAQYNGQSTSLKDKVFGSEALSEALKYSALDREVVCQSDLPAATKQLICGYIYNNVMDTSDQGNYQTLSITTGV